MKAGTLSYNTTANSTFYEDRQNSSSDYYNRSPEDQCRIYVFKRVHKLMVKYTKLYPTDTLIQKRIIQLSSLLTRKKKRNDLFNEVQLSMTEESLNFIKQEIRKSLNKCYGSSMDIISKHMLVVFAFLLEIHPFKWSVETGNLLPVKIPNSNVVLDIIKAKQLEEEPLPKRYTTELQKLSLIPAKISVQKKSNQKTKKTVENVSNIFSISEVATDVKNDQTKNLLISSSPWWNPYQSDKVSKPLNTLVLTKTPHNQKHIFKNDIQDNKMHKNDIINDKEPNQRANNQSNMSVSNLLSTSAKICSSPTVRQEILRNLSWEATKIAGIATIEQICKDVHILGSKRFSPDFSSLITFSHIESAVSDISKQGKIEYEDGYVIIP